MVPLIDKVYTENTKPGHNRTGYYNNKKTQSKVNKEQFNAVK